MLILTQAQAEIATNVHKLVMHKYYKCNIQDAIYTYCFNYYMRWCVQREMTWQNKVHKYFQRISIVAACVCCLSCFALFVLQQTHQKVLQNN